MSQKIFESHLEDELKEKPLEESMAAELYLIADYHIDINKLSKAAKPEEQQYVEKLFLATITLMSLLDKAFIHQVHLSGQENMPALEQAFFECLKNIPLIALKHLPEIKEHLSNESLMQLKERAGPINQEIAQGLESWFQEKKNHLHELLSQTMHHEEKDSIAQKMIHALYSWRESYISTKKEKILQAFENLNQLESTPPLEVAELSEEEKLVLLRPHLFYSPFYALCHLDTIPIELSLEITMILEKVEPSLSNEELLRIEETHNVFALEYLKILNNAERDRNVILHSLNTLSEYFQHANDTA